ncbi:MAG TPA: type III-A CRISPR-associated RAMP protein Csm4 [Bacteroidales bacterium]|nr:type III-A CRISPR-associated RAMP protein Csm4 [Bacteroidales bacterium]
MKNLRIVRLTFTSPLHISNVRGDYDISERVVHSDTIYSAIIEAWNVLGLNSFIPSSNNSTLGFSISSLFPFYYNKENNKFIYFLPRPASFKPSVDISINKKVKKIEYIDNEFFKELQKNGQLAIDEKNIKGSFYTQESIDSSLIQSNVVSRVRVPRSQGDAQPFYTERIYFKENAGLYFFLQYESESVEIYKSLISALDYLKDEGIGTDRHIGNGMFIYEIDDNAEIIHFTGIDTEYALNLSLYIPESHEKIQKSLDEKCYFEILTRGGWITTYPYLTLRKKYVRAIKEASVLKTQAGIYGKIADISPDRTKLPDVFKSIHPIYRIGRAIWVPIKIQANEN